MNLRNQFNCCFASCLQYLCQESQTFSHNFESLNKNIGAESKCTNNSNRKTAGAIHVDGTKRKSLSLEAIFPVTKTPCMRKVRRF